MKDLLNERIANDKVPWFYWLLKEALVDNLCATFFELFGIK